jgi:hypothetical protein
MNYSADFGTAWLVQVEYNTDEEGRWVDGNVAERPTTLHGPFKTRASAARWMADYPSDKDVFDMRIVLLNKVK